MKTDGTDLIDNLHTAAGAVITVAALSAAAVLSFKASQYFSAAGPLPYSAAEIATAVLSGNVPGRLIALGAGWACAVGGAGSGALAVCGLHWAIGVLRVRGSE